MIAFSCVNCGQRIEADDSAAGRMGQCPYCQAKVPVPVPAAGVPQSQPAPVPEPLPKAPAQASASPESAPAVSQSKAGGPKTPASKPKKRPKRRMLPYVLLNVLASVIAFATCYLIELYRPRRLPWAFKSDDFIQDVATTAAVHMMLYPMVAGIGIGVLWGLLLQKLKAPLFPVFSVSYSLSVIVLLFWAD